MTKLRTVFIAAAVISTNSAAAHSYNAEISTSLYSTSYKDAAEIYESDSSDFYYKVNLARVNLRGKVAKSVKYRLRFNLNKDTSDLDKGGLGSMADYATISHKVSEVFTLSMGKSDSKAGAFEESFHFSENLIPSAFRKVAPKSITGVFLTFSPLKHNKMTVSFSNNPSLNHEVGPNADTDSLMRQQTPMLGLVYTGKLIDGIVKPFLDAHIEDKRELKVKGAEKATLKAATNQYLSAGLGFYAGAISGGLDHKIATLGSQALEGAKDDTVVSSKLYFAYEIRQTKYFVDLVMDESKSYKGQMESGDLTTTKANKVAVGAFLTSDATDDLTYHFAYTNEVTETSITPYQGTKVTSDLKPAKASFILGATLRTGADFAAN